MAWVGAVAGAATTAVGNEQAAAATIEGAQTQAAIEAMNRAYQRQLFDEQTARQTPFYEAAVAQLPMLEQFRTQGGVDLSQNPLYQMQQRAGAEGLRMAGVRPQAQNFFAELLNATSQDPAYQRGLDLQQVGLGSAERAGNYSQNLGNALQASFQNAGNALAQGTASAAGQRQSLYSNLAGDIGSAPAYFDYLRRSNPGGEQINRAYPNY